MCNPLTMKHIFSLLLLAAVCMCLVIGSHVKERTAVDIWLYVENNHFREYLIALIPVFIYQIGDTKYNQFPNSCNSFKFVQFSVESA